MAESDGITVAVIGTGSIGTRHLACLREVPGVRAVAVPVRPERLAALRAEGIEACAVDELPALAPAGVVIATDTSRHLADARAALSFADVLVEKPLAANIADSRALSDEARRTGRRLHVACCLRFSPGLRWVHERLPAIGRIRMVDAECLSWLPSWRPARAYREVYSARSGEGGALLDLVHEIDYCEWLAGRLSSVSATLVNTGALGLPADVEETAILTARTVDGAVVDLRLGYATRPTSRRVRLFGDEGVLECDLVALRARRLDLDGCERESLGWETPQAMYAQQARAWIASLRGERADELVDGETGARAVAVCDAARRASTTGLRQELP